MGSVRRKTKKLLYWILGIAGFAAVFIFSMDYLTYEMDPVGYRNIGKCHDIPKGTSLAKLKEILGAPVQEQMAADSDVKTYYFASGIAGGVIRAEYSLSRKIVTKFYCHEEFSEPVWSIP